MGGSSKKIIVTGPYPPPFGGISVHIQRITQQLRADEFVLYNSAPSKYPGEVNFYGKKKYLIFLRLAFSRSRLVHTHSTDSLLRIFFGILGFFNKNVYLHIHGESLTDYLAKNHLGSRIMGRLIRNLNILACNSDLMERLGKYNPRSITEIDAYVPPKYDNELLDDFLGKYGEFYNEKRFIMSMTGWFDYYMKEDLYGYDITIRALKKFIDQGIKIYLAVSVNGVRSTDLYDSFVTYIRENGLDEYVLLIEEDLPEAWPVFFASDLFLRPTNTDGAAVSIKEALWSGIPVIASDVIVRPEEVTLFKNRSVEDLYSKMLYFYKKARLSMEEKRKLIEGKKFSSKLFNDIYGL